MSMVGNSLRMGLVTAVILFGISRSNDAPAAGDAFPIEQQPLYMATPDAPLMMLVMSRDEQLFNKAYSDYTDLNGDGVLDTTYNDTFGYAGYFDSKLCYSGGTGGAAFKAAAKAAGANGHSCTGGQWSGNFLNWVSMSRLDIVRSVLYGGKRSTDDDSGTVLSRAHIPSDTHAWAKMYNDVSGQFTPFSSSLRTYCSVSLSTGSAPLMRVAEGAYSQWAATEGRQCELGGSSDRPAAGKATDYTVRVQVCADSTGALNESFCRLYSAPDKQRYKPAGLLQEYGESDRLRFGLISGSYGKPRSGGVLRRNIGRFAANGARDACASGDEVNLQTGQFCNQVAGTAGIINTVDRFELTQWNAVDNRWIDCNGYAIYNRARAGSPPQGNRHLNDPGSSGAPGEAFVCSPWGNPVAEMYAEALRYIGGASAGTTQFAGGTEPTGLPVVTNWLDPYRLPADGGNSYCASCSILILSSGLPSFDGDGVPAISALGATAAAATDVVGTKEGITGNPFFAGRQLSTTVGSDMSEEDFCRATVVTSLGGLRGLCPDSPPTEGSFLLAGLAHKAATVDMRPSLQGKSSTDASVKRVVKTYAVAMAESLPKFTIPLGNGEISLSPFCQSAPAGNTAVTASGWAACSLVSVAVEPRTGTAKPVYTYGRPQQIDPVSKRPVAGSFSLVWEDSLYGSDHDQDLQTMVTYCIGSACNTPAPEGTTSGICWRTDNTSLDVCGATGTPSVGESEMLVRVEILNTSTFFSLKTGFNVTGSNEGDGLRADVASTGGHYLMLTTDSRHPAIWSKPRVYKFTASGKKTGTLESPLWYAAKYGNFDDKNGNGLPDPGEWDSRTSGEPDGYFLARNPAALLERLKGIFDKASGGDRRTGLSGAGLRVTANSFTVNSAFSLQPGTNDWTGTLTAYNVNPNGSTGDERWKAKIPAASERNIVTSLAPTLVNTSGAVTTRAEVRNFKAGTGALGTGTDLLTALGLASKPAWAGTTTTEQLLDYLRGDQTYEKSRGGPLRTRGSVLGDIVNSNTVLLSPRDDFGWRKWQGGSGWRDDLGKTYATFLTNRMSTANPAAARTYAFVGANDGILHGFDAQATNGGKELFGYVPATSRVQMHTLADPLYVHRYFVDGQLTLADVPQGTTGWKSVLVAATGAGGRSISALNVTDPSKFDTGSVLWELRGSEGAYTNLDDLGNVLGRAAIVPVKGATADAGPRWVAIFGNGVNSTTGRAVLFVVDIDTGAVLARLRAGTDTANGLMNIAAVSMNDADGLVDVVYGGDMKGNLWKFDLSSRLTSGWNVAFTNKPLFTAKNAAGNIQPITGGLEVSRSATGGAMVYFGTGSYFKVGDGMINDTTKQVQSFYGINDNNAAIVGERSAVLTEQVITVNEGSNAALELRNVSSKPAGRNGWFVDLKLEGSSGTGERFFGRPTLQSGNILFATFEPQNAGCNSTGINRVYTLNVNTGGGAMQGLSKTPGGASLCTGDCGSVAVSGLNAPALDVTVMLPKTEPSSYADCSGGKCDGTKPVDPAGESAALRASLQVCTYVTPLTGLYMPRPCGRQSWRQIR